MNTRPCWFVGAVYHGTDDQLDRFLAEGIWENGYDDKHFDIVRSMRPGDRIAIKSAYVRKKDLPFDNKGQSVSVMAIKAIGTILENLEDGKTVRVEWTRLESPREWYFYTFRQAVWRVLPGEWMTDALIAFAFEGQGQDIDKFRNAPYWKERFGTRGRLQPRFEWTLFYEAFARALLRFKENRGPLIDFLRDLATRVDGLNYLAEDGYVDGSTGFVRDICPFTTMGIFNRGITDVKRKAIAAAFAEYLNISEPLPVSFEAIPILNNQRSWFFPFEHSRSAAHIDALWQVFDAGLSYTNSDDPESRDIFVRAFDQALQLRGVSWNLTMGLFWASPWNMLPLDNNTRTYIRTKLALPITKQKIQGSEYVKLMDTLETRFAEESYSVHSYPELSLASWQNFEGEPKPEIEDDDQDSTPDPKVAVPALVPYELDDVLKEGCFLDRDELERILQRLREKKNLILQGPPGTGKTWLAKRLAYALIGERDDKRIRAVQFHPNLSYEDFVRGWRPTGDGKLTLADGVFMQCIKAASLDSHSKFVVVIEEINRGNPAQIFGELLTLLEAGKRTPQEALELCYPDADGQHRLVHIPENLYVIGTMNIADRSLAIVDFALRRRFAFVDLEPRLGAAWKNWVVEECNLDDALASEIEHRINNLNSEIAGDPRLGKKFQVGHSYVTPVHKLEPNATRAWFRHVVETEIGPLLEEYWFDSPSKAAEACSRLLAGWS